MHRIDEERMLLLFEVGDREPAIALAEASGFTIKDWCRQPGTVMPIDFSGRRTHVAKGRGIFPQQVEPGIYAYRITRAR